MYSQLFNDPPKCRGFPPYLYHLFEAFCKLIKSECTKISNEDDLQWKMTTNGRRPQNMKSGIDQQPLVGSYSNFKLKLRDQIRVYKGIK